MNNFQEFLLNSLAIKILISILLSILFIYKIKNLLIFFLFLPWVGFWIYSPLTKLELQYQSSYFELLILLILFIFYLKNYIDKKSLIFLILPFFSIFQFLNCEKYAISLFFFIEIFFATCIYSLVKNNFLKTDYKTFDIFFLILFISNILMKIWGSYREDTSFLLFRGGYFGSNYIANYIILFFPFIQNKYVKYLIISIILLTFSRGLYIVFIIYFFLNLLKNINLKTLFNQSKQLIIWSIFILILGYFFINIEVTAFGNNMPLWQNLYSRFRITEDLQISDFIDGVLNDERSTLHEMGYKFISDSKYLGIGFGNTVQEFIKSNYTTYTNLHSLWLTILLEGGLFFTLFFIILCLIYLYRAYKYNYSLFVSLFCWLLYSFQSGELYECGGMPSIAPYIALLILFAKIDLNKPKHV